MDSSKYTGSFSYVPIINQEYYLVGLTDTVINGQHFSQASSAIIDSGTSFLVGPSSDVASIAAAAGASYNSQAGGYTVSCSATVPTLTFTLGSTTASTSLTVSSSNWVINEGGTCILALEGSDIDSPTGGQMWILGDAFMRNFYTVFDVGNARMGFAPVVGSTPSPTQSSNGQSETDSSQSSNKDTSYVWIWPVGILIGLVVGFLVAYVAIQWRMKRKEQEKNYVKMVEFVQE